MLFVPPIASMVDTQDTYVNVALKGPEIKFYHMSLFHVAVVSQSCLWLKNKTKPTTPEFLWLRFGLGLVFECAIGKHSKVVSQT